MLLDQFTPEQIKQLKKELKNYDKVSQKEHVTHLGDRLRDIFPYKKNASEQEDALWYVRMRMRDKLYEIADVVLCNVEFGPRMSHKTHKEEVSVRRNSCVPEGIQDEYKTMIEELLGVIEKHGKAFPEAEEDKNEH